MPHRLKRAEFSSRAAQIQVIAAGIYDKTERQVVLQFVRDAQKLVEIAPPEVILTALNNSEPRN